MRTFINSFHFPIDEYIRKQNDLAPIVQLVKGKRKTILHTQLNGKSFAIYYNITYAHKNNNIKTTT